MCVCVCLCVCVFGFVGWFVVNELQCILCNNIDVHKRFSFRDCLLADSQPEIKAADIMDVWVRKAECASRNRIDEKKVEHKDGVEKKNHISVYRTGGIILSSEKLINILIEATRIR